MTFKQSKRLKSHVSLFSIHYPNFNFHSIQNGNFGQMKEIRRIYLNSDPIHTFITSNNDMLIASSNTITNITIDSINTINFQDSFENSKIFSCDEFCGILSSEHFSSKVFAWCSIEGQIKSKINLDPSLWSFTVNQFCSNQILICTSNDIFQIDNRELAALKNISDEFQSINSPTCIEYSPVIPFTFAVGSKENGIAVYDQRIMKRFFSKPSINHPKTDLIKWGSNYNPTFVAFSSSDCSR
jgi:hypothetical protein